MNSTAADYLPPMIKFFADHFPQRHVVMINPNDEVGVPFVKQVSPEYLKNGFTIVDSEMVERDLKDFNPLITRILGMKPDVIDFGGIAPATAGLMLRQLREQGYTGLVVKTAAPSPKEIVAAAGKEAAEGILINMFADRRNEGFKAISERYKQAVGQEPNDILVQNYDGVRVLFRAIELSGDPNDAAKIIAAFPKALPMKSVQGDDLTWGGKSTIGADRQVMSTEYVGTIRNGEPVVLGLAK
jgi:branched-chain amino acid transport system substrate-binding protein